MNNCKNCGARLQSGAKMCPNCGALIDEKEGYVLLTDDDMMFDVYNDAPQEKKKKKGNGVVWFLSILLTLVIVGGGAYYYFTNIYNPDSEQPELTFTSGCGIINDDEKIVYVLLDENSNIQYIHGVSISQPESSDSNAPVLTDYEYTKSIDSTFRAIFFDVDGLSDTVGNSTYTFEMKFSFNGSDEVYTYMQSVTVPAEITENVSDLIFDHSQSTETTTQPQQTTEPTTQATQTGSVDFIYDSYWFTEPVKNGDELIIAAIKFKNDNTYTSTNYYKNGSASWQITTYNGKFKVENGFAVLDNGEATESTYYKIDTANKSLYEEENGKKAATLTSRKYNSIKNVEDFFGI